jgi:hypothetical protein
MAAQVTGTRVSYQPMVGMVDSPHEIFVGHGAEKVGEPTDLEEAGHIEWVPLADIPGLMARGELLGSGTLVALLHTPGGSTHAGTHSRSVSRATRRRCRTEPVRLANWRACRRCVLASSYSARVRCA